MLDVFRNRQRPNYEEIITYGPRWWLEWLEMDANYRYAGWTLDLMAYWMERVISNQFPRHADLETVEKLEKLFNIDVDYSMTLEERRRVVESYYFYNGHLSRTVIQSIIMTCTECESRLWWDGEDNNILKIDILQKETDISAAADRVFCIIERRKPAHIAMNIRICVQRVFYQTVRIYSGGVLGAWYMTIPFAGQDRLAAAELPVSYAGFVRTLGNGQAPDSSCMAAGDRNNAGGVYCHTHIKSRLIG